MAGTTAANVMENHGIHIRVVRTIVRLQSASGLPLTERRTYLRGSRVPS